MELHSGILTFPGICCLHSHKQATEKIQSFSGEKDPKQRWLKKFTWMRCEHSNAAEGTRGELTGQSEKLSSVRNQGLATHALSAQNIKYSPLVLLRDGDVLADRLLPKCC